MIHEVEGDILLTDAELIAHGVAPDDNFHSGLALELRKRWPAMYNDFRHYCKVHHPKEGTMWAWGGPSHVRVANLLTQGRPDNAGGTPGRATLPNVNHALHALAEHVREEGYRSVAITRIATGPGGLDWEDVKPVVERTLGTLGVPVYVYSTFHAGQKAEEPLA